MVGMFERWQIWQICGGLIRKSQENTILNGSDAKCRFDKKVHRCVCAFDFAGAMGVQLTQKRFMIRASARSVGYAT
jgi:hypothetical protein